MLYANEPFLGLSLFDSLNFFFFTARFTPFECKLPRIPVRQTKSEWKVQRSVGVCVWYDPQRDKWYELSWVLLKVIQWDAWMKFLFFWNILYFIDFIVIFIHFIMLKNNIIYYQHKPQYATHVKWERECEGGGSGGGELQTRETENKKKNINWMMHIRCYDLVKEVLGLGFIVRQRSETGLFVSS